MIGTRLNHYEILDRLGQGGMGKVYRARDTRLDRQVAIKVLPDNAAEQPELIERFQREAKALAALSHPGIVTVYSVERDGATHFITMELVQGSTLTEAMEPAKGIPLETFFDLAVRVCDALAAAHERGVVHRDLKPANIMIGLDGRPKILDFGLAKLTGGAAEDEATRIDLTSEGQLLGTTAYMSPEQAAGRSVDHRSDIFSLGCVLYELLAGRRPFSGDSAAEVISSILRDAPASTTSLRTDCPPLLDRALRRCLNKDPDRRFQSTLDLRNELQEIREETALAGTRARWSAPATEGGRPQASDFTSLVQSPLAVPPPVAVSQPAAGAPLSDPDAALPSIAVLPFVNMSADPDNEYFSDGLTEELMSALGQLSGLRVAARASSFHFKGSSEDLASIARQLRVATVLEGSVRRAGEMVRVTVQHTDVAGGSQLWSERFDRRLDDIFAVQDEIAARVVERLRVDRTDPDASLPRRRTTDDLGAYQLYLQGRFKYEQRGYALNEAAELFRRAIEIDAQFVDAHQGLADAYCLMAFYGNRSSADSVPHARAAASRVLELQPQSAGALRVLAFVAQFHDWRWEEGAGMLRRAVEIDPRDPVVRYWRSLSRCMFHNDTEGAIQEARRGREQDPASPVMPIVEANALFFGRRFEEAWTLADEIGARSPGYFLAPRYSGLARVAAGRAEEALPWLRTEHTLSGGHLWAAVDLTYALRATGRLEEADELLECALERRPHEYVGPTLLGIMLGEAGRVDEGKELMAQAYEKRDTILPAFRYWPIGRDVIDEIAGDIFDRMGMP